MLLEDRQVTTLVQGTDNFESHKLWSTIRIIPKDVVSKDEVLGLIEVSGSFFQPLFSCMFDSDPSHPFYYCAF